MVDLLPFDKPLHFEKVLSLYGDVFGESAAASFRARFRWAQEESLFPRDTPKWVLADGADVVGFVAAIPQRFRIGGRDVVAHSSSDFMVRPDHRFHGIRLMREVFRRCENCVSLDDVEATIAILGLMKCRVAGELHRYAKVLDGRAARGRLTWAKNVPEAAFSLANVGLRAVDRARGSRAFEVREVAAFDARFDRFFERLASRAPAMMVRDAAYLDWRYGPSSPQARRSIGAITDPSGELLGYVVFCASSSEDRAGWILELHGSEPRDEIALALLSHAVERLRESGAWLARYHHMPSSTTFSPAVLERLGFVRRQPGYRLMVKLADPAVDAIAADARRWNYSFGDSEASHGAAG
jgi:hypothetical protein